MKNLSVSTGIGRGDLRNFAFPVARWPQRGLTFVAAIATGALLLLGASLPAQASAERFVALCSSQCHSTFFNGIPTPPGQIKAPYNTSGNVAIINAAIAAGMTPGGTPADYASIAAYLETVRPSIASAPVAHNSTGTVINIPDIRLNSRWGIITSIATVTPPTKGTVTYHFDEILSNETVTYTPFPGQSGTDTWTYQGSGSGLSTTVRTASVVIAAASGPAPLNYSDMWWVGEAENGWGMSIQQHGNIPFIALYVYDNTGKPTWYVLPSGTWNADFTIFTGALYQPTSAPLNNYTPTQFVVPPSPGSVTLTFTSNSTATMQYTINGVSGQKLLKRQEFGTGSSPLTVGDMWWAGSTQDGWGINLVQHGSIVFGVWYTYGPDGKPTWFVLPNGSWTGTTYSGPFYSTTGSAWLGAAYNPNQLTVTAAGTLSFNFAGANNATMNYNFTTGPFAGTTQSKAIVRQPY